ncbi:hypothetical protein LZ32DRAFT_603959 [Colletotrichum eremochloae]|nr:hypothetical protein LZ32DRAFT_603959 [Colletotrichum eremochloae]
MSSKLGRTERRVYPISWYIAYLCGRCLFLAGYVAQSLSNDAQTEGYIRRIRAPERGQEHQRLRAWSFLPGVLDRIYDLDGSAYVGKEAGLRKNGEGPRGTRTVRGWSLTQEWR